MPGTDEKKYYWYPDELPLSTYDGEPYDSSKCAFPVLRNVSIRCPHCGHRKTSKVPRQCKTTKMLGSKYCMQHDKISKRDALVRRPD